MKKRIIASVLIGVLLLAALSACKRQEDETIDAAAIAAGSGTVAENGKTVVTAGKASGTSEPLAAEPDTQTQINVIKEEPVKSTEGSPAQEVDTAESVNEEEKSKSEPESTTGPKEQHASLRLPDGVPFKAICLDGEYCEGMEEYIPDSFGTYRGEVPANAEEYVYRFDADLIKDLRWESGNADRYDSRPDASSFAVMMEALGGDGYIVIGHASGKREGHLAYYADIPIATVGIAIGYTLTDFTIDEILYGGNPGKKVRVKEDYLFGKYAKKENILMPTSIAEFALMDDCKVLLFLKKMENQELYEIVGGYGGLPLTNDYKNYNQEYVNHLAGYLNLNPEYCDKKLANALTRTTDNFYIINNLVNQSYRSVQEVLEANADDLIVALALQYHIVIWPLRSRGYEESGLPHRYPLAGVGCSPDLKPYSEAP